jgi:hypothetical protein
MEYFVRLLELAVKVVERRREGDALVDETVRRPFYRLRKWTMG